MFHLFVIKYALPLVTSDFGVSNGTCCLQIMNHFTMICTDTPLALVKVRKIFYQIILVLHAF